jgi:putative peptidoglycan lipid II flippase
VIGIAVGVVLLPELSRALKSGDHDEAEKLQNRSLEFALALTLPAAVGFMIIPEDIVRLLYERGEFDAVATSKTALALAAFATGLPAYVMMKVFQPAFFAREDMRTPFWFSCIMVVTNIALSLALFPTLGHVGIAIATSVSAWVNLVLLVVTQWRRGDFKPDHLTLRRLVMLLVSAITMGIAIWVARLPLAETLTDAGFLVQLVGVGGLIGLGAVVYFAICFVSGAVDQAQVKRLLRR